MGALVSRSRSIARLAAAGLRCTGRCGIGEAGSWGDGGGDLFCISIINVAYLVV